MSVIRVEFNARADKQSATAGGAAPAASRQDGLLISHDINRVTLYVVNGQGEAASGAYLELPTDPALIDRISLVLSHVATSLRGKIAPQSKVA